MSLKKRIAFFCYFAFALMGIIMGLRYLIADQIRPHHLEILGALSWDTVDPAFKVMMLMLMKGAGLGYLITGLAVFFMLFGSFRRGEQWAVCGIMAICVVQLGGRLVNVLIMQANQPSAAPVYLLVIAIALTLFAFVLSLLSRDDPQQSNSGDDKNKYPIVAFGCFFVIVIMSLITAFVYTMSNKIMPYHIDAMGLSGWEAMQPRYQFLMLTYMRGAGLGFLTMAVAGFIFLLMLFQKNDSWSRWGLYTVCFTQTGVMLWIVMTVRIHTPGQPPMIPLLVALMLTLIAFAISETQVRQL